MSEVNEMKSLTLGGKKYDSFPDQTARAAAAGKLPGPASAAVGQYLVVEEVDADGKITKVKAVEAPGGSSDSGQNPTVEPMEDDIPKVYITGTLPVSKTQGDMPVTIRYISKTKDFSYPATLKVQGGSSVSYPKKNFTVKFYEDEAHENKKKMVFKGWPKMNKFVLKSHWIDHSHVRNVGTARIWGKIVAARSDYDSLPEELRSAANNGATDGFSCKVFANGVYQGLYEWIVPKDKLFGQDKDIPTHSIMNSEKNDNVSCAFATTTPTIDGYWSEELQDEMSADISQSFANLIKFVAGSTDEEFVANAETYFDVQSVIDFDIFARVFCIVDNLGRNQIFFTYDGQKWYEGCWDVDAVLGAHPTGGNLQAYNTEFQSGYFNSITNLLYERVETLFMDRFKARYAELRADVLSIENIIEVYERLTDVITTYDGLLAEDYASTTGGGAFTGIPHTADSNIQQIRNFIAARIPYMDEAVGNLFVPVHATAVTLSANALTFNSYDTQTIVATVTPADATDTLVWTSSNEAIATVEDGVVTPLTVGDTTITARAGNVYAECAVTVESLPSNVTDLEYITLTGAQVFNTEIVPDKTTGVEAKYVASEISNRHVMSSGSQHFVTPYPRDGNFNVAFAANGVGFDYETAVDTEYLVTMKPGDGVIYINGENVKNFSDSVKDFTTTNTLTFGGYNMTGENYMFKGSIYYAKIYSGDSVIADFVPQKRNNVVGFYDKVRNKFYTSETATAFIAGPEIA